MLGRPRRLTELQRLVVVEAYASRDATARELAAVYGMCTYAIYITYLRGHTRPKSVYLDRDLALTLRSKGMSVAKVAQRCEVSRGTIERLLREKGLTRPRGMK